MPTDPSLQGLRALLGGAQRFLNEGPLGHIEVPAPGPNPTAGQVIGSMVPSSPEEMAIMAAVPPARALPPLFRQAVIFLGKRAKAANLAQMSQQEALIWSHDMFRAGIRIRNRPTPQFHHSRTGETHKEMARRLQKKYGFKAADMEPIYYYQGKVLERPEGEQVGRALAEVVKRVRDPKINAAAGQPKVQVDPVMRDIKGYKHDPGGDPNEAIPIYRRPK